MPRGGSLCPEHRLEVGSQAIIGRWIKMFAMYFITAAPETRTALTGAHTPTGHPRGRSSPWNPNDFGAQGWPRDVQTSQRWPSPFLMPGDLHCNPEHRPEFPTACGSERSILGVSQHPPSGSGWNRGEDLGHVRNTSQAQTSHQGWGSSPLPTGDRQFSAWVPFGRRETGTARTRL